MEAIGWLIVFAVMIIIEIVTLGLTTIWFAAGSLIAFFAALLGANLYVQAALCIVISTLLLVLTRPIAKRYFNTNVMKTNVDRLIGMTAKVTVEISNNDNQGYAVVCGQEWTARTEVDGEIITVGELVTVKSISGVKLIVSRKVEE